MNNKALVSRLDHINFSVRDLDEALRFYEDCFGFEEVESGTWNGTPWAIARSGDAMLCMYEHPDRQSADHGARRRHTIAHIGFRIRDEARWLDAVEAGKAHVHHGPIDYPHSRSWYVADPSGHEIEVVLWNGDAIRF